MLGLHFDDEKSQCLRRKNLSLDKCNLIVNKRQAIASIVVFVSNELSSKSLTHVELTVVYRSKRYTIYSPA